MSEIAAVLPKDPFNERERRAWEAIGEAHAAIYQMDERRGLMFNHEELAAATHVLQDFVKQHMCHRIWPHEFSDWWDRTDGPEE